MLLIRSFISSFFFLSNFQTLTFFVTLFSDTVTPKRLKLGTHIGSGEMYRAYRNQDVTLIRPFISSFFFISNFQTLKFFVTLFSGIVRPGRLKLGTHMDSGEMYRVDRNQDAAAYSSLYFFIFLSLQFSNIKNIFCTFLWNFVAYKVELDTNVDNGWMYRVYRNQAAASYLSLISLFFFLSNFQKLKSFVTLFLGTVRPRKFKFGTLVDNGWMYRVYQNQAAFAYFSHYFFIFLSLKLSNINIFRHTFLRNCEA